MRKRNEAARNKIVTSPAFIKLFEKAKSKMRDPKRKTCKHGHAISAANAHVGDMKRLGRYTCDPCNTEAQARYHSTPVAAKVAPRKTKAAKPAVSKPQPAAAPVMPVPDDPQTSLMIALRTADVEYNKLPDIPEVRSRWARQLMGAIATNFGVHDFQVRRPVLVMDQARALPMVVKAANA